MSSSLPSLTSLLKQTHIDDHEQVLKAAESTLKQSKGDLDAQHVKLVALLKLDRYDDGIQALEAGGDKLKDRARLEYSYALYKSGKPKEAAHIAAQGSERGYKHVEAQASYRTEDFKRAAELYRALAARIKEDAEADIRVNSGAVDAQLEWAGQGELVSKKKPGREDLGAFETAYNAACGSIARGELGQGEVLLKRARDLCNAAEDLSEVDKQAELRPISVQQVYVLARLGRLDEAEQLAKSIDTKDEKDASTRHIAQVNSVASSATPANPFLTHRIVTRDLDTLKPDYPFHYQAAILKQNHYAADLQSMKYGGTASSTQAAVPKQAEPTLDPHINSLSAVNAAAHARSQTGKEALKHILPLLEKRPNDVGLILTICQLYVSTNNAASAINMLDNFLNKLEQSGSSAELDVRFAPGLVGTIVSLHSSQGRRADAQSELAKAAKYWRRKSKDRPAGVVRLLKAAGSALLDSQNAEQQHMVHETFEELHKRDAEDRYASAGLLAASPGLASSQQASQLTSVERLTAGIDADALESAGIVQPPSTGAAVKTRKRPAEDAKSKKPKKIRKSRLPKDYDPNKKPDAERWLPLRDRSTYRPKGKKGKARQAMLAQGAIATESDGSRPGTPGGEVVKGKQPPGGGGQKKKKGKGGKW